MHRSRVPSKSRHRVSLRAVSTGVLAAALLIPSTAGAQGQRVSLHLEGGATALAGAPQGDLFSVGGVGAARVAVRVAGALGVHAMAGIQVWPSAMDTGTPASAWLLGVGLRFAPRVGQLGAALLEFEGGASVNGAEKRALPFVAGGAGFLFRAADVLDVGPVVRVGAILPSEIESASNRGTGAALYWSAGLNFALHLPEEHASVPPAVSPPEVAAVEPAVPEHVEAAAPVYVEIAAPEHAAPEHTEHAAPEHTEHAAPEHTEHAAPEHTEHAAPEHTEHAAPEHTEHAAPSEFSALTLAFQEHSAAPLDAEAFQQSIAQLATYLRAHDEVDLVAIESHTHAHTHERRNERLSNARVTAVRSALIAAGVMGERIAATGYGSLCMGSGAERTVAAIARVRGALVEGASFGCALGRALTPSNLRAHRH